MPSAIAQIASSSSATATTGLREDTARLLSGSDLLLVSSISGEVFPSVLGEAMACRIPCIDTDVGDPRAIAVPLHDDQALAATIAEVLFLPAPQRDELGHGARLRAVSTFDIRDIARRYQDLYVNLMKDHPCAA